MARHEQYLWKDPFDAASSGSVLLSDQIHFLSDEIGLIDPFDEKHLRPAAYDLRVGDSYYEDDVRKDLTAESSEIEIPPNGLVYVKTKEKFNIPYYLVARYSLRVHQVYRGLLIDNGLHIDPGYCGYIWIPVHNFTKQPRVLSQGHEFISVEFNRTTPLPRLVNTMESQDELVARGVRNEIKGSHGRAIKIFYKDLDRYQRRNDDFTPRLFWDKFPGERHQSAMLGTDQQIAQLRTDVTQRVDSLENIGWIALAGLAVAILGIILGIALPILYGEFGKNREVEAEHGAEIRALSSQMQEQKARVDAVLANQPLPGAQTGVKPAQQKGR